jgi:hypothetical protein
MYIATPNSILVPVHSKLCLVPHHAKSCASNTSERVFSNHQIWIFEMNHSPGIFEWLFEITVSFLPHSSLACGM